MVSLSNQGTRGNCGNTPFDRLRTIRDTARIIHGESASARSRRVAPYRSWRVSHYTFGKSWLLTVRGESASTHSGRAGLYAFGARASLCPLGASPLSPFVVSPLTVRGEPVEPRPTQRLRQHALRQAQDERDTARIIREVRAPARWRRVSLYTFGASRPLTRSG